MHATQMRWRQLRVGQCSPAPCVLPTLYSSFLCLSRAYILLPVHIFFFDSLVFSLFISPSPPLTLLLTVSFSYFVSLRPPTHLEVPPPPLTCCHTSKVDLPRCPLPRAVHPPHFHTHTNAIFISISPHLAGGNSTSIHSPPNFPPFTFFPCYIPLETHLYCLPPSLLAPSFLPHPPPFPFPFPSPPSPFIFLSLTTEGQTNFKKGVLILYVRA